jgi:PEP-CTERM motif
LTHALETQVISPSSQGVKIVKKVIVVAVLLAITDAAMAAQFTSRDTRTEISFSGGLASAVSQYDNTIILPVAGTSGTLNLNLKTGAYDLYFATTGGISTAAVVPPAGTPVINPPFTNDGSGGTLSFGYKTATGPDFGASWTQLTKYAGLSALRFVGGGTNFVDDGGIFTSTVVIKGDWSAVGVTGGHVLVGFNPAYSATSNFVYDNISDTTRIGVQTTNFVNGSNPSIDFFLLGGAVPEPSSWALLITGFGLTGAAMRRRRLATALAAGH